MNIKSLFKSKEVPSEDIPELIDTVLRGALGREPNSVEKRDYHALVPAGASVKSCVEILLAHLNPYPTPRFVPPGHHYSPIGRTDEIKAHLTEIDFYSDLVSIPGIRIDRQEMLDFWGILQQYLEEIPFKRDPSPPMRYGFDNGAYSWGDGSVLYAMIRYARPKKIIEIGSGWSSVCTLDTLDTQPDYPCEMTVIEPFPELMKGLIGNGRAPNHIMADAVQRVPLNVYEGLEKNDILFIDSTHVVKTGSDVCHEIFNILPKLRSGVIVHFHDVFWPFEYSHKWAVEENRSWSEIYLLRAFLMNNPEWKVLIFNDYLAITAKDEIEASYPDFMHNPGGAIWLKKL